MIKARNSKIFLISIVESYRKRRRKKIIISSITNIHIHSYINNNRDFSLYWKSTRFFFLACSSSLHFSYYNIINDRDRSFECSVKERNDVQRHFSLYFFLYMCEPNHHFCPMACLPRLFKHLTSLLYSNMSIKRHC